MERDSGGCRERPEHVRDVLAREFTDPFALQSEIDRCKWPSRQIHNGACQGLVEGCEGPAKAIDATPFSECLVDRLAEREPTVLSGVMIIDVEVAFARELQVEPGMATQRVEEVIEESDPGLDCRRSGPVETQNQTDRRFARGACDGGGASTHGSNSSRSAILSSKPAAPALLSAIVVAARSSPGATMPSGTTDAPAAARMSSGVFPTIQARRTPRRARASRTGAGSGLRGASSMQITVRNSPVNPARSRNQRASSRGRPVTTPSDSR